MPDKKVLKALGPCGLSCEKCFAFADGGITEHSRKLKELLGNFDMYARRFQTLINEPVFGKYPAFKELLAYFTAGSCPGCRQASCHLFDSCKVKDCHKEKKVDFCFQCSDFPCQKTNFDDHLQKRWLKIQERMREIGPEAFYQETINDCRYK